MKFAVICLMISAFSVAKPVNFDAFKVDTSISDLKPVKSQEQEKVETAKIEVLTGEQESFQPNKRYKAKRSTNVFLRGDDEKRSDAQRNNESARLANPML